MKCIDLKPNLIITACNFICINFIFFSTFDIIFTQFLFAVQSRFFGSIRFSDLNFILKTSLRYFVSFAYIYTFYFQLYEHQIYVAPSNNHIQFEVRPFQGSPHSPECLTVPVTDRIGLGQRSGDPRSLAKSTVSGWQYLQALMIFKFSSSRFSFRFRFRFIFVSNFSVMF